MPALRSEDRALYFKEASVNRERTLASLAGPGYTTYLSFSFLLYQMRRCCLPRIVFMRGQWDNLNEVVISLRQNRFCFVYMLWTRPPWSLFFELQSCDSYFWSSPGALGRCLCPPPPAPGGKGGLPSSSLCWSKSHGGQDLRAQAGAGLPGFQCSSSGTSCATSDKLLSLSVLQFPHL